MGYQGQSLGRAHCHGRDDHVEWRMGKEEPLSLFVGGGGESSHSQSPSFAPIPSCKSSASPTSLSKPLYSWDPPGGSGQQDKSDPSSSSIRGQGAIFAHSLPTASFALHSVCHSSCRLGARSLRLAVHHQQEWGLHTDPREGEALALVLDVVMPEVWLRDGH